MRPIPAPELHGDGVHVVHEHGLAAAGGGSHEPGDSRQTIGHQNGRLGAIEHYGVDVGLEERILRGAVGVDPAHLADCVPVTDQDLRQSPSHGGVSAPRPAYGSIGGTHAPAQVYNTHSAGCTFPRRR